MFLLLSIINIISSFSWNNPIYSPQSLKFRGLPLVNETIPVPLNLFQFDIISRKVENLSFPYCQFKNKLKEYCCYSNNSGCPLEINDTHTIPYSYCIISEIWPQPDIVDWLNNTAFGDNTHSWTGFSMFCSCKVPGRAFWIDQDPNPHVTWHNSCSSEIVLLSLCIILAILYIGLFIYQCYVFKTKIDIIKSIEFNTKNLLNIFTLLNILWFLFACILRFGGLIYQIITRNESIKNAATYGWIVFWSSVCILIGSIWVIFLYSTMALRIQSIIENQIHVKILSSFKYIFTFCTSCLICLMIIFQAITFKAIENIENAFFIKDFIFWAGKFNYFLECVLIIALLMHVIIFLGFIGFLTFISYIAKIRNDDSERMKIFIKRIYYLYCATLAILFFIGVNCTELGTLSQVGQTAFYSRLEYESNTAYLWTGFFQGLFSFFWNLFCVLSISVAKSIREDSNIASFEKDMSNPHLTPNLKQTL